MKGWLGRAAASTVRRGEGRTPATRWSRWFPTTSPVDDALFQGPDDPYPGHWRELPPPWPPGFTDEEATVDELRQALEDLTPSWRAVAQARDVAGRGAAEVADDRGITVDQEQRILNRARAALREALGHLLSRREP